MPPLFRQMGFENVDLQKGFHLQLRLEIGKYIGVENVDLQKKVLVFKLLLSI